MASLPTKWGGANNSKNYELMMEADSPLDPQLSLVGTGVGSVAQELSDPVTRPVQKKVNGRIREYQEVVYPAEQTSVTINFLLGDEIWTPLLHRARQSDGCPQKVYALRLCPENPENIHAFIWDATLNRPSRVNDFIPLGETTLAQWQTEGRSNDEVILWAVGAFLQQDNASPLYAVTFLSEECASCANGNFVPFSNIIAVGGIGGVADPLVILKSDDRGASADTIANDAPDGSIGRAIWSDGNIVLIGFSDEADTAGTTGGTLFSSDAGETFQIDSNLSVPILAVGSFGGKYIAAGGTGAGDGQLYTSDDGVTWTSVTSALLTGQADAITGFAVDVENGVFYITSEAGNLLIKGRQSGGGITLTNITSALPGAPSSLLSVDVIEPGRVAVGGASGYYAESLDGGVTWAQPGVPGTATVNAIAGRPDRSLVGTSTNVVNRSLITKNTYTVMEPEDGVVLTGDVRGIAKPHGDEFNFFVAVTDDGEIVAIKPYYPNA